MTFDEVLDYMRNTPSFGFLGATGSLLPVLLVALAAFGF